MRFESLEEGTEGHVVTKASGKTSTLRGIITPSSIYLTEGRREEGVGEVERERSGNRGFR